jgi:Flp pilus assembly pilin Flp
MMKLLNVFKSFANDESGAVTVDWVVLTAAIVGLGVLVFEAVKPGIETLAGKISAEVAGQQVGQGGGTTP